MIAPRSRLASSTSSLMSSPPPSSLGLLGSASTETSFSDEGTEIPPFTPETPYDLKMLDQPLIDLNDGEGEDTHPAFGASEKRTPAEDGPTPGEKLRMLLRLMEAEVQATTPAPRLSMPVSMARSDSGRSGRSGSSGEAGPSRTRAPRSVDTPVSSWRANRVGRTRVMERDPVEGDGAFSTERSRGSSPAKRSEDDDSPPTPPLRITNPYVHGARRVGMEREFLCLSPLILRWSLMLREYFRWG